MKSIKDYKTVIQKEDYDCGVASAMLLLENTGIERYGYTELQSALGLTEEGVSYKNLEQFFSGLGEIDPTFHIDSNLDELKGLLDQERLALVLYQTWGTEEELANLECGHYSVAVGIEKGKIYLLDPTSHEDWGDGIGWRVMDLTDFDSKWIDKDKDGLIKGWMISVKPKIVK